MIIITDSLYSFARAINEFIIDLAEKNTIKLNRIKSDNDSYKTNFILLMKTKSQY